jgi:hypothetical protein
MDTKAAWDEAYKRVLFVTRRLPDDTRAEIIDSVQALSIAVIKHAVAFSPAVKVIKAPASSPPSAPPEVHLHIEPGAIPVSVRNVLPADGIRVQVEQSPRSIVLDRDEHGNVVGARG